MAISSWRTRGPLVRRLVAPCALAAMMFAFAHPAQADICYSKSKVKPQDRIAACTAVLNFRSVKDAVAAHVNRGTAYQDLGDHDRAIQDYDEALRLDPNSYKAFNNRCWARATAGRDLEAALEDCDNAVVRNPGDSSALQSRSFVLYRLGRFDSAIATATSAMVKRPKFAGAFYVRGLAKLAKGDQAGGAADIAAAKAIDPGVADEYAKYGVSPPV